MTEVLLRSEGHDYDVVVLGGGPAGATAAALLAQGGASVLLLEKERHPRFHIGESLLPATMPLLERLGVRLDDGAFVRKAGAEFIDETTGDYAEYLFRDGLPGTFPYAYQVERALFDAKLLDRAREFGADVREGVRAESVMTNEAAVVVRTAAGSYNARYCVDATGQDAFMGRRDRTLETVGTFGRAAVFRHYSNLNERSLERLGPLGNIKILILEQGWSWIIPLARGRISVGLVSRRRGVEDGWIDTLLLSSSVLTELTAGAAAEGTRVIRNYSYRNQTPSGARYVCIGDSACFLDPVFSSGVWIAMESAESLTELLLGALRNGKEADPELCAPLEARMSQAYTAMRTLIYAFYHTEIVRNLFFALNPSPEMRSGLVTMLAGHVFRTDNRFQERLLSSTRRMQATAQPS